jgi:hypothetical protein
MVERSQQDALASAKDTNAGVKKKKKKLQEEGEDHDMSEDDEFTEEEDDEEELGRQNAWEHLQAEQLYKQMQGNLPQELFF